MIYLPNDTQVLFSQWHIREIFEGRMRSVMGEIDRVDSDLILTEDSNTLAERLFKGHVQVNVPSLLHDHRYMDHSEEVDIKPHGFTRLTADMIEAGSKFLKGTRITLHLPFEGHPFVFNVKPTVTDTAGPPRIYRIQENELLIVYETTDSSDPSQIISALNRLVEDIERYLRWIEDDVSRYHLTYLEGVRKAVADRQKRLRQNRSLEEGLGIPLKRTDPPEMYRIPITPRKTPVSDAPKSESSHTSDPHLSNKIYEHILSVLSSVSSSMERSPSAFRHLDEENLRWWFVAALNGHYEGGATGETFNASGKTDILISWKGKNVFVVECKFWQGRNSLDKAVDQLLGYTTWRNTKTAILVFSRKADFSRVLSQIPEVLENHEAFEERLPHSSSETEFRFRLRHPKAPEHKLELTVLAFDVPKVA
jgi:hypothetical protein